MEENTQKNNQHTSTEADEHLMEHNYDGIQELDNPPPRWIMAIFYITIGFSIIYAANYLQCREVIGCHYDSFPVIEIDKEAAIKNFTANGLILNLLKIGESFEL